MGFVKVGMSALAAVVLAAPMAGAAEVQAGGGTVEERVLSTRDAEAMAALDRMGAYLRSLKVFRVVADTAREDVLDDGQKLQRHVNVDLLVSSPDRLVAREQSDRREREYFYDGQTFTLYARLLNVYATIDAPGSIGELSDMLEERYQIEMPLVDLFRWGGAEQAPSSVTSALVIGPSEVNGMACQHYAFRQEGLDWQIWIQQGDFPLPRKLVLTTTSDEARPQYVAIYTWDMTPSYGENPFVFEPPAASQQIIFSADSAQ